MIITRKQAALELYISMPSRQENKIYYVSLYENEDWSKMSEFLVENLPKFENAFHPIIEKIKF